MLYTTDLEKLRLEMFRNKVTQEKLAEVLKIARSSVWRKFNNESEFTVRESQLICDYLGVNPAEIFFAVSVPNKQL